MSNSIPAVYDTKNSEATDPRAIGSIITQANNLTAEQIEAILEQQRKTGQRFGEAAVELGLIRQRDVVWALAQQFDYPYRNASDKARSDELIVANEPFSDHAELFRDLRSQLLIKLGASAQEDGADKRGHCIAVISTNRGDGKSFIGANLALAFAQLGGRVAIVDADMRNSRQQNIFEISEKASGLSEALSGRADPGLYVPAPEFGNLFVLPTGVIPPNPQELVERSSFSALISELRAKFDYVLVDTPAFEIGIDCISIAAKASSAVIVTRKGVTRAKDANKLRSMCARAKVNILGTILNDY